MKEKCIADITAFLESEFLNQEKYNNILYGELKQSLQQVKAFLNQKQYNDILYGELKQSLIQVKNFLTTNLNNVKYTQEFLKRMEILDRLRGQNLFTILPELKQIGE